MANKKEETKKGSSKKELPDLTGKESPRTCIVTDLADEEGDIPFYLIKQGKQKARVFPQDPDRFVNMLRAVDPSMELEKTGYLVDSDKLDKIVDNSKEAKGESTADLDNLMAKLGLNKEGTAEATEDEEDEAEEATASVKTQPKTGAKDEGGEAQDDLDSLEEEDNLEDDDEEDPSQPSKTPATAAVKAAETVKTAAVEAAEQVKQEVQSNTTAQPGDATKAQADDESEEKPQNK